MKNKILLLIALVCMLVPFVVLGNIASAEEVTPRIVYNSEIRIVGVDWSKIEDFTLLVVDRVNDYNEFYSYDEGDFTSVAPGVLAIAVEEPDLLSGDTWLCFGVDVLEPYTSSTFKLTGLRTLDAGVETSLASFPYVNMVKIPLNLDDFEALICNFAYLDLTTASTESYNAGYNVGVQDGMQQANSTVNVNSLSYQSGYNQGREDAGNLTFMSLIGAVLDAPIRAFFGFTDSDGIQHPGLFSLEILGFDMSAVILSIFTLCVIIVIVRMCLGGK